MKFTDDRRLSPAARALRRRLFDVLPAGSYQLDRLFQLFDIEASDAVPTAAVTNGSDARLLVNPGFIARYCETDEALFVLVLHELLHVVLGHTRLYPLGSWAQNVAFDAVINAMIARAHPQPAYLELLRSLNDWETFPGRLLRPAPGWPDNPQPLPADASERERDIHARLYSKNAGDVTYHEILALVQSVQDAQRTAGRSDPPPEPLLLGGHGDECGRRDDVADGLDAAGFDPTPGAVISSLASAWPAPMHNEMRARGAASEVSLAAVGSPDRALVRALAAVFARAGCGQPGRLRQRAARHAVETAAVSVVPQPGDRRAATRQAVLGRRPIFWTATHTRMARGRAPAPRAFVYFDVSMSMNAYLPALREALCRPVRDGVARVFAFSTEVHEVDVRTFGCRNTITTGGTEGNAVLRHLLALPVRERPRSVVLVTDGCVGALQASLVKRVKRQRIAVHVALTPNGPPDALRALATRIHRLPLLGMPSRPRSAA